MVLVTTGDHMCDWWANKTISGQTGWLNLSPILRENGLAEMGRWANKQTTPPKQTDKPTNTSCYRKVCLVDLANVTVSENAFFPEEMQKPVLKVKLVIHQVYKFVYIA